MKEPIYKSCFSLKFDNESIEAEWQKQKQKYIRKMNKIISTALFVVSIGISVGISFYFMKFFNDSNLFKVVLFTSYIAAFVYLVNTILSYCVQNIKIIIYVQHINYILFAFLACDFRFPFLNLSQTNAILFYILFNFEILARVVWVLLQLQGFLECFILNSIQIALIWILYAPNFDDSTFMRSMYNILAYTFTLSVVVFFSYILERQQKNAFFFSLTSVKKAEWFMNIFENMNTGFLSIKGDKVSYLNSYLAKKIKKSKQVADYFGQGIKTDGKK